MFRQEKSNVLLIFAVVLSLPMFGASLAFAQLGAGTGGTGGGGLEGQIIDAVNNGGGVGGGTTGGTTSNGGTGTDGTGTGSPLEGLQDILGSQDIDIAIPMNERDQAFVGVSPIMVPEGRAEFRHVGPLNEFVGSSGTTGTAGGGGNRGGFGGASGLGGGGLGAGGSTSSFTVQRSQSVVRSRIVPGFQVTPLPANVVASRFNRRMATLPTTRQMAGQINVSMQGRTAVITGTASDAQQVDRIQRQLRLEPGVSRVVNQVRVGP